MNRIKHILFDFGNVLWNLDIAGAFESLGQYWSLSIPKNQLNNQLFDYISRYETGQMSTEVFIHSLLKLCNPSTQAIDIVQAWNSMLLDLPMERLDLLKKLKKKYKLYLLSNINELHFGYTSAYLSEVHDVQNFEQEFFDQTFYSHIIKLRKPNLDAFQYVIEKTGLIPAETLFVDDIKENTATAASLGFQTLNLKPNQDIVEFFNAFGT